MRRDVVGPVLFLLGGGLVATLGCGSGSGGLSGVDAGSSGATGTPPAGVGDPCTPAREQEATFNGFDEKELVIETSSRAAPQARRSAF